MLIQSLRWLCLAQEKQGNLILTVGRPIAVAWTVWILALKRWAKNLLTLLGYFFQSMKYSLK